MTSTVDATDRVSGLARGMRELVAAEAAESERMRTLTPAIVEAMWDTGLMSAFNPVAAGGVEPSDGDDGGQVARLAADAMSDSSPVSASLSVNSGSASVEGERPGCVS